MKDRQAPRPVGSLPRHERLRAVAGVAQVMLGEARAVFALIAAGRTVDGPLTQDDIRDLAEFGLTQTNPATLTAMIDEIEALHGR